MDDDHDGTISLAELEKTMIKIKDLIENEKTNSLDCEKVSESLKNKKSHIQNEWFIIIYGLYYMITISF